MMTVHLNQTPLQINKQMTLAEVLTLQGFADRYFAVAINKKFIPRTHYTTTVLTENDMIDIILPMQGG